MILKIVVIVLIAAEIGIAWMEGRSQSKALDAMADSANQFSYRHENRFPLLSAS